MKFALRLIAIVFVLAACSSDGVREYDLWVGPQQVDCVGAFAQRCLLVKESPAQEWQLFYDHIERFTYEPGFNYRIRVRRIEVDNPPADASSYRYLLIRIIEKMAATP